MVRRQARSGAPRLRRRSTRRGAFLLAAVLGCRASDVAGTITRGPTAFVDVTIVSMEGSVVTAHQTVLVRDGHVVTVGDASAVEVPKDAVAIDGTGKFLTPGLIDMHVHIREGDLGAYVRAGITSVRNMWGYASLPDVQARVKRGDITGPSIYSASPGLDGPPAKWPETVLVTDANAARGIVTQMVQGGWLWIKVYDDLPPAVYDSIVAAAADLGIPVVGHVPVRMAVEHALDSHQRSIEHLRGYDRALTPHADVAWERIVQMDESLLGRLAAQTRDAGTWVCPTLAIYGVFYRGAGSDSVRAIENRRHVVRVMHDAGVRLLVGTDAGIDRTAPGASIHQEMAELAAAGISAPEIFRMATRDAAEFLGALDSTGTIAVGKRADLLLLSGNPLLDVGVARRPAGVMARGVWNTDASH